MAFRYVLRRSKRARKRKGLSFVARGKKPPLGSGTRFRALKKALRRKGARSPGALAAWIGRRKYGRKRFAQLSAAGRRRE